ncbi:hypothetical protein [Rubellimicrobium mesophilum]|uniref:hypothetical protein n=1 Tax=Rubellimicrobium mesophilum TaxID=1123067 RepID=UPI00068485B3|nr:hypothetical protein [Rubellimicrobium mesophilum]
MRSLFLALAVLAGPALAQEGGQSVTADLDKDGAPETYSLLDNGTGTVDLTVESASGTTTFPGVAWTGGMAGQEPDLSLSPAGSVLLASRNDSVGRDRWTLVLTIAQRDGALKVAGITYERRDTLDPEMGWGTCDLNLLSGRGVIEGPGGRQEIAVPGPAPRLSDWQESDLTEVLPAECFG